MQRKYNFNFLIVVANTLFGMSSLLTVSVQADNYFDSKHYSLKVPFKYFGEEKDFTAPTKNKKFHSYKVSKGSAWLDKVASSINSFQELSDKANGLNLYNGKGWKNQLKIKDNISEALQAAANNVWSGETEIAVKNLSTALQYAKKDMKKSSERDTTLVFIEKYILILKSS
ncbi:MAG: hypothetical protein L3J51_02440 [Cocleimonas sp.]|nr:hypothetical protein [Cocleimonas sp.]